MKLIDVLITILLGASTAAAAAISYSNTSTLVNVAIPGPNAPIPILPQPNANDKYKIECVSPSPHTLSGPYDDYWHSMDIFCHYLEDSKIEFKPGEVFGAADSLCNSKRCFFVSAKKECDDPIEKTPTWHECIAAFEYPFNSRSTDKHQGPCSQKKEHQAGATILTPTGCWNFSVEVHRPLLEW
ncbi:hypothetical protein CB0940_11122 [Cercospora beticola]|uniref:Ecp2 effector protein domain-containing protein n=1 Tax=Cercospora beticola TaxID=122368 RepID=A0A2G5HDH3_CERBT|nr:hypothetical protein CB0940_11122 [Cercospora beticola]PIA90616.1 hypothetical protein CB0940_11122 [Cercospora beticola]WPB07953.1 hypothetical protein RHO25_012617 [Cercospora beticola]